jgi:hypothetical protein
MDMNNGKIKEKAELEMAQSYFLYLPTAAISLTALVNLP